jgi:hypothetical protein
MRVDEDGRDPLDFIQKCEFLPFFWLTDTNESVLYLVDMRCGGCRPNNESKGFGGPHGAQEAKEVVPEAPGVVTASDHVRLEAPAAGAVPGGP